MNEITQLDQTTDFRYSCSSWWQTKTYMCVGGVYLGIYTFSPKIQIQYFLIVCLRASELIKQLESEKPRLQRKEKDREVSKHSAAPLSLGAPLILGKGQEAENPSRLSSRQKVASGKQKQAELLPVSRGQ